MRAIDSSAVLYPDSRGRIGCGDNQVLVISNTQQPDVEIVLSELANLDYIEGIEPTYWE